MWVEELPNNKFKYFERYTDPYTEKTRRVSTTLTSNSAQAQKKAKKILDDKIKSNIEKQTQSDITFKEVFDEWYHAISKSLRASTLRSYDSQIKIIKVVFDDDILIRNLDTKLLQKFFNQLDYSNDYVSSIKSILNKMLKYALRMEYIPINPMDNVELIKKAKTLEDYQSTQRKFLEKEEADLLIQELYRRPSTYRLGRLAEFMYLTGTRIGEAVILTENDFDFKSNVVNISGTIDIGQGYLNAQKGPTKTLKGTRKVDLTKHTIELIKRSLDENKLTSLDNDDYKDNGFIFTTKRGIPVQTNSFNIALKGAGERVGLKKNLSSHIFRHSHISLLAEMNIPLKAIMDRVGHDDSDITNKIYTHVTNKMKLNIIENLESIGF